MFAAAAFALAGIAAAPAQQVEEVGRIVVTATRAPADALTVPAAIDVIDADDIRRGRPLIDLSESLHRVPGVVARDRQNAAQDLQISIRGFGARSTFGVRGVRIYTDGIPATMPDGQGQVSHVSLESARRIEVLRGPFSALYGNASGGVIEVISAAAPAEPVVRAGYVTGGDALHRWSASLHAPVGDGAAMLDVTDVDSGGYRDHSAARRQGAQALFTGALGARGRFTAIANGLSLDAADPQGLTRAQLADDRRAASAGALAFDTRKSVRQSQFGARGQFDVSDRTVVALLAYTGRRRTTQMLSIPVFVQAPPTQGGGAIDLDRDFHGFDARWHWRGMALGRAATLTAGVLREVSDERRLGFENFVGTTLGVVGALRRDELNRVSGDALYVQAEWQPAPRWHVHLGARRSAVRFDSADRFITASNPDDSGRLDYEQTSPVAGVLYRVSDEFSVYANAGEGFETPTFSELAYRSDGASGLNDALSPAVSRNHEVGVRVARGGFRGSAAVFHIDTADELAVVSNTGGRSVYGNVAGSRRHGVELSLARDLSRRWRTAVAYTWLDARYDGGARIPGLARQSAWAELVWSPRTGIDFALEGWFVDRVWADDENTAAAPAYARFDLSAERRFRVGRLGGRVFARLNNVTDRAYVGSVIVNEGNGRYYEPAPGRNVQLGVNFGVH
ncbi:MAG: TonB-dependent receptor [Gammaproteobacteria bacterium]